VDIFKAIKSIQKIDRKILPHAEKNLLVSILIHLGENGNIWPTNEQIGQRIGESKDYAKNLIMRLKNKGYLTITGRGKNRRISVIEQKIFGNSQLPNQSFSNSQLPNQAPKPAPPLLNKVVVVLLEKYGFNFGPVVIEKLSRFSDQDQIRAIESTKAYATSNPARYIERILDNDCKGIILPDKPVVDQYAAERERMNRLIAESRQAKDLGFKTAEYSH